MPRKKNVVSHIGCDDGVDFCFSFVCSDICVKFDSTADCEFVSVGCIQLFFGRGFEADVVSFEYVKRNYSSSGARVWKRTKSKF